MGMIRTVGYAPNAPPMNRASTSTSKEAPVLCKWLRCAQSISTSWSVPFAGLHSGSPRGTPSFRASHAACAIGRGRCGIEQATQSTSSRLGR